jgi:hypothetical protein
MRITGNFLRWLLVLTGPATLGYAVWKSDGWRPQAIAVENRPTRKIVPDAHDVGVMCNQAIISVPQLTHTTSCLHAHAILATHLGTTAAGTLVQSCGDRHAIIGDNVLTLPNASLCRYAVPTACATACGSKR